MASKENNQTPKQQPSSDATPEGESLADRFARVCAITPLPKNQPAQLPGATEEELRYLLQNDAGEIFMSPDAIWENNEQTRPIIRSAMHKALRHVCRGHDVDILPTDEYMQQLADQSQKEKPPPRESGSDANEKHENNEEDLQIYDENGKRRSCASILGLPEFTPVKELRTLTWANSEAKKVIDEFNAETERIRTERAAKEAAEEAALMAQVPEADKKETPVPEKPSAASDDPVVWAAQEEAAVSSAVRDLRARNKKSLWGSKSSKMKPEAAAEMARARVAAAAAAAVMRNEDRGEELIRAETIDGSNFLERFAKGKQEEGGFYPMHAQAFQRAMSLDSHPDGKKKKKVAFAADTVFSRKK